MDLHITVLAVVRKEHQAATLNVSASLSLLISLVIIRFIVFERRVIL